MEILRKWCQRGAWHATIQRKLAPPSAEATLQLRPGRSDLPSTGLSRHGLSRYSLASTVWPIPPRRYDWARSPWQIRHWRSSIAPWPLEASPPHRSSSSRPAPKGPRAPRPTPNHICKAVSARMSRLGSLATYYQPRNRCKYADLRSCWLTPLGLHSIK